MRTEPLQDKAPWPLARAHFSSGSFFLFSLENGSVLVVKSMDFVVSQTRV